MLQDKAHEVDVLRRLTELELDRTLALDAAITHVADREAVAHLKDYRAEHEAYVGELKDAIKARMAEPPERATLHGVGLEARIAALSRAGDPSVLSAVIALEDQMLRAYGQAAGDQTLGDNLREELRAKHERERSHREWLAGFLADYR